jgi:fructokinase
MKPKVLGIGELLWDVLPSGARMGGAPANFACHASALGAAAGIISRVGADEAGDGLLARLRSIDVDTGGISLDPDHATGSVDVRLGGDGQPQFVIHCDVAWDHLSDDDNSRQLIANADAVCFGSLGQRSETSRQMIRQLVMSARPDALRIFDVNLRQDFFSADLIHASMELASVVKLSDSELPIVARLLSIGGSPREQIATLAERYSLRMVVYTRGSGGSILYDGKNWQEHGGTPTEVKDTIGAGDSFTAAVTLGMLHRWPIEMISDAANDVASHVCSCIGAIPPMPGHILDRFHATVPQPVKIASRGATNAAGWFPGPVEISNASVTNI